MNNFNQITDIINNLLKNKITPVVLLAIVSMVFCCSYATIFDKKIDLNGDNIYYFSTGKAIAEGKGYTNVISFEETPHTHFPPGYSIFIAGLQKISPNNIVFIKKINGLLLWLSLILLFLLIKRISNNILVAFFTTFFVALQKNILSFSTIMMSEMLYIFLSLSAIHLALYLNEKLFLQKGNWKIILLLILFLLTIVYLYFLRTIGISLILALAAWFGILAIFYFFKYKRKTEKKISETEEYKSSKMWILQHIAICVLIVASFFAAQRLWNMRQTKAGVVEMDYKKDFYQKPDGEKMETWTDWATRLKINIPDNVARCIPETLFFTESVIDKIPDKDAKITSTEWIRGVFIILVMMAGLLFLQKKSFWLLFFYLSIYMTVVILYPEQYQGIRYWIPIIPFFIFLFFNGLTNITQIICQLLPKKPKTLLPQIMVLCICTFIMFPVYIKAQSELRATAKIKSWVKFNDRKMANYLLACKFCKDSLPNDIKVITRKPELFYMFSGYKKSKNFPWYVAPDTVMSYLKNQNATHVIVDDWFRHAYLTIFPAVLENPEKFKVLKIIGDTANNEIPTYVFEFNDEWGYYGTLVNGEKIGEGYEYLQNGQKYVGHFEHNSFNGNGTLYDKNGNMLFKGYWINGEIISGEGELNSPDGKKYIGQFTNLIPNGYGTLYDSENKIIRKGRWRNGFAADED